jgi:hypothetical protein
MIVPEVDLVFASCPPSFKKGSDLGAVQVFDEQLKRRAVEAVPRPAAVEKLAVGYLETAPQKNRRKAVLARF